LNFSDQGSAVKTLMTVAIATMAGLTGVNAADLPARTYSKAPPPIVAPAYSWTGFYVGVNIGGVWAKDDVSWRQIPPSSLEQRLC
jgi:outer membrane immunogenic protein